METTTCEINGHADVYGLGIRLGFYLQWFGVILASWIAPSEVHSIRHANAIFLAATLLSLIALRDALAVPESYVVLLFLFGSTLYAIPKVLLRYAVRCCGPRCALATYSTSPPRRKTFGFLWSVLVLAETFFLLWFTFTRVATLEEEGRCVRYGFLFAKMRLHGEGFLHLFLGVLGFLMVSAFIGLMVPDLVAMQPRRVQVEPDSRFQTFRLLESFTELYVTVVVTIGIEVSIMWNNIRGVGAVNTTGQLIPLLIGIGAMLRIIYVFLFGEDTDPLEDGPPSQSVRFRMQNIINRPFVYSRLPVYEVPVEVMRQEDRGSVSTEMSDV
ncbi:hypothetical protein GGR53DRAFT_467202 [Hypoxylon sp. FL1150]|nr:hypothetical protein GGR53DRAFT_467202 [Hypoxylon sp. FL1150]